jgi:hypothetical protein
MGMNNRVGLSGPEQRLSGPGNDRDDAFAAVHTKAAFAKHKFRARLEVAAACEELLRGINRIRRFVHVRDDNTVAELIGMADDLLSSVADD